MEDAALYAGLGKLLSTFPDLGGLGYPALRDPEVLTWLGRAAALVEEAGDGFDAFSLKQAIGNLGSTLHVKSSREISMILHRVLARIELKMPVNAQGAFIPVGNTFDALAAIAKIMGSAKKDVFMIDPYLDERAAIDFAPLAPLGVAVRLLTDEQTVKPGLRPAVEAWVAQYMGQRPMSLRYTPPRQLHDRLLIIDSVTAWSVTQSFKDLAARSPATILPADPDLSKMKTAAYESLWNTALAIV